MQAWNDNSGINSFLQQAVYFEAPLNLIDRVGPKPKGVSCESPHRTLWDMETAQLDLFADPKPVLPPVFGLMGTIWPDFLDRLLACWQSYNPLFRYALQHRGVSVDVVTAPTDYCPWGCRR